MGLRIARVISPMPLARMIIGREWFVLREPVGKRVIGERRNHTIVSIAAVEGRKQGESAGGFESDGARAAETTTGGEAGGRVRCREMTPLGSSFPLNPRSPFSSYFQHAIVVNFLPLGNSIVALYSEGNEVSW